MATVLGAWIPLVALATLFAQQPRDGRPSTAPATGAISGSVVTRDGQPVDRAVVTISSEALRLGRSAITDERGTFSIEDLPPGRMTIAATKPGFLGASYGATQPGGPGTAVVISAGQSRRLTIAMTRGGVITGTIRDERGLPIPDLTVLAAGPRSRIPVPPPVPEVVGTVVLSGAVMPGASSALARTDERGVYRFFDLYPGEYLVVAVPPAPRIGSSDVVRRSTSEVDAILARLQGASRADPDAQPSPADQPPGGSEAFTLAPTFHPGTPNAGEATAVRLGSGEERAGIDVAVRPVPVASASGVVTSPGGVTSDYQLSISPANWTPAGGFGVAQPMLQLSAVDRFTYVNLVPGRYTITARTRPPVAKGPTPRDWPFHDPAAMLYAVVDIDIGGADVAGIDLRLGRGARVAGRIVASPASAGPAPPRDQARVFLVPESELYMVMPGGAPIGGFRQARQTVPDAVSGEFEIAALAPGRYWLNCQCGGWRMQSATVGGRDLLDAAFDVTLGTDIKDIVLTITNRSTEISGSLQTAAGQPAPEFVVIAFPADRERRLPGSRRIRATRPATDGSFAFADLPPGEYLLAALTELDPDDWQKPEFLEALVPSSVKITLGEGERKRQDLRIGR